MFCALNATVCHLSACDFEDAIQFFETVPNHTLDLAYCSRKETNDTVRVKTALGTKV